MIGVIVVAHGNLAQEFSHVVQKIMGPQENLHTLSIDGEELFPQATETLKNLALQCDTGDGVLILTDLLEGLHQIWLFRFWGLRISRFWRV